MRVGIPSALFSYTGDRKTIEAEGATLGALLVDLDRRYPGLRFRIVDEQDAVRPHIRIFVNGAPPTGLDAPLDARDEVYIVMAFSGG